MAKSVKNVIKGFNFETSTAKVVAKKATDGKNSEVQVSILCNAVNDACNDLKDSGAVIVKLRNENAKCKSKLSNVVNLEKQINTLKGTCNHKSKTIDELHTNLQKCNGTLSNTTKELSNLEGTIDTLNSMIDAKNKSISILTTDLGKANGVVDRYERNWFVKWFLKK